MSTNQNIPPRAFQSDAPWLKREPEDFIIEFVSLNDEANAIIFETNYGQYRLWLDDNLFSEALDPYYEEWDAYKVALNEDQSITLYCYGDNKSFSYRVGYNRLIDKIKKT